MGTAYSKKLLVLYILDILQKYTDEEHRLSQKEILEILRKEYEMIVDRKTVRRNLLNLTVRLSAGKYSGKNLIEVILLI